MRSGLHARLILLISLTLVLARLCLPAEGFVLSELLSDQDHQIGLKHEAAGCLVQRLGGSWSYRTADGATGLAQIPCVFDASLKTVEFTRSFRLSDSFEQHNWEILIPAYRSRLDVHLNGHLLATGRDGDRPLSIPLRAEYLKIGSENEITLEMKCDSGLTSNPALQPGLFDPAYYPGVLSDIYLIGREGWTISEIDCHYAIAIGSLESSSKPTVFARVQVSQHSGPSQDSTGAVPFGSCSVAGLIRDSLGLEVTRAAILISDYLASSNSHPLEFPPFQADAWTPDQPRLYTLETYLVQGLDTLSRWSEAIGFRNTTITATGFESGGMLKRLRALDYVPQDASGFPVSYSMLLSDILRIKELGFNAIRIESAASTEETLSIADSIGMWVITDIGLKKAPSMLITAEMMDGIRSGSMQRIVDLTNQHPCILAVCAASLLEFGTSRTDSIISEICDELSHALDVPISIETTGGIPVRQNFDFVMLVRAPYNVSPPEAQSYYRLPVVYSQLGWLSAASLGNDSLLGVSQSSALRYQIGEVESRINSAGYAVHCYADYQGAVPLIVQRDAFDNNRYSWGLLSASRRDKPAVPDIAGLMSNVLTPARIECPPVRESNPVVFPIIALGSLLALSIAMRTNNVLRQSLRRVLRHSRGFFSDIRYRRYFPATHSLLLWLLISISSTLMIVPIAYRLRANIQLDYLLSFIGLNAGTKVHIGRLLWSPGQATAVVLGVILLLFVLHAFYLKLISKLFRPRVNLNQAWNYLIWSSTSMLFLLPLGALLYRLLQIPSLRVPVLVIGGSGYVWSMIRLMTALQNGFQTSFIRICMLFLLLTGIVLGGLYIASDQWLHLSLYWKWLKQLYPIYPI